MLTELDRNTAHVQALRDKQDPSIAAFAQAEALWKERMKEWRDGQQAILDIQQRANARRYASEKRRPMAAKAKDISPTISTFQTIADKAASVMPLAFRGKGEFKSLKRTSSDALLPERVRLRARKARRCGQCDKLIVKPEAKMNSTNFTIRSMALLIFFSDFAFLSVRRSC